MSDAGLISDGYHTFNELYDHRNLLFIALCLEQPGCCCWNRNGNYDGYFCLYRATPYGEISYHIPDKYLYLIESVIEYIETLWDGHTSQDVLARLEQLSNVLNGKDKNES